MTIGIPRALIYWKQPHFWETFFEELGFKVLLSPPTTNKEIIDMGVRTADSETCFSTKVFYGHILFLEGKVNFIFIPRLKKNKLGLEYCPKFFALPELASLLVKTKILSPWIDEKKENLEKTLIKLGKEIGKEKTEVIGAMQKSFWRAAEIKKKKTEEYFEKIKSPKKIVLISHPYNLYDAYVNLDIKKKIEDLGIKVIFIDEIPINETRNEATPKFHWEFGEEMLAQVREVIKKDITGAIEISSFQCGCDAVLKEFIEKEFRIEKIPFLYLLIDEHTAEAGLQTRLEAFMDTL